MKFYVISGGPYNDRFTFSSKQKALIYANKDLGIYPREWDYDWVYHETQHELVDGVLTLVKDRKDKCYGNRTVKRLAYAPGMDGETYFLYYVDIANTKKSVMSLINIL